ncbi:MAG: hypothetical protein R3C43_19120 [Chloroflexota bacterium]
MRQYHFVVHRDGPALWPEHKPLAEVLKLRDTTPELTWEGTYQGNPTPAGGYIFRREWWSGQNRYDVGARLQVIGRFQSWDTAEETNETSAYTACVTGDILDDYRLVVRDVYRERLTFDVLPATMLSQARMQQGDNLLRGIVIEDKSSGKSAHQTLRATSPEWLRELLSAYRPVGSKEARAGAAAVWCRNGMVLLPQPGPEAVWLMDFEDELFNFPQGRFADQVDAFSQLILYVENYLAEGWRARGGG